MGQEHNKRFKCGHKEKDLSWSAWVSTRVCCAGEQFDQIDELCHECMIYETAKVKILAARTEKRRENEGK
jgi:hypothetical protein